MDSRAGSRRNVYATLYNADWKYRRVHIIQVEILLFADRILKVNLFEHLSITAVVSYYHNTSPTYLVYNNTGLNGMSCLRKTMLLYSAIRKKKKTDCCVTSVYETGNISKPRDSIRI